METTKIRRKRSGKSVVTIRIPVIVRLEEECEVLEDGSKTPWIIQNSRLMKWDMRYNFRGAIVEQYYATKLKDIQKNFVGDGE